MSFPVYDLQIYSAVTGERLAIITDKQFTEMRFTKRVNAIGALAVTFETDIDRWISLFNQQDMMIDVRRNSIVEGTFLLTSRQRGAQGLTEYFVIGGMSPEHLMSRRLIDPADDVNQPNGGYVTKAGPLDTILRELLRENMADLASDARQFPNVVIADVSGTGDPRGFRLRYDKLDTTVYDLLESGNIDLHVVRTTGNTLEFRLERIGTDRAYDSAQPLKPVTLFSPERGNLLNPSYLEAWDESITFVYIGGAGDGATRTILKLGNNLEIVKSPYGRRESFRDMKSSDTAITNLYTEAITVLQRNRISEQFEYDLVGQRGGSTYRVDYFIGDYVTIKWGEVFQRVRITQIEFNLNPNGETMTVQVDTDVAV